MEQIGTGTGKGANGKAKGKGRMDADKQPAVKQPDVIAKCIDKLVRLHVAAKEATEEANEAITKAAEDSGYLAVAVRKLVVARAGDNFEEAKRKVEQQMELFEEVGE